MGAVVGTLTMQTRQRPSRARGMLTNDRLSDLTHINNAALLFRKTKAH